MRWPWLITRLGVVLLLALAVGTRPVRAQTDAAKSGYDFHQLSNTLKGDQVDYFSGDWSYSLPLLTVQGAGGLALPLRLEYSSAITGVDRLTKLSPISSGTHTLNTPSWVGLGWNLNIGAITVTGGYEVPTGGGISNHPLSYDLSMVVADGTHRLVRQLGADGQPSNRFFTERQNSWDIVWNYDPTTPLTSTWTVYDLSGNKYTFGAVTINGETCGANLTMHAGRLMENFSYALDYFGPEWVYQWKLAEIRDPEGNAIRFTYDAEYNPAAESYRTLTTYRSTSAELGAPWRRFDNVLQNGDLDPRQANSSGSVEVIKTQKTAHLTQVRFYSAAGHLVRTIDTETSERWDLPLSWIRNDNPTLVSISNLNFQNANQLNDFRMYRSLDGLDTFHRLDALTVKDSTGTQLARVTFLYKPWTARPPVAPGDSILTMLLEQVAIQGKGGLETLPASVFDYQDSASYRLSRVITPTGGTLTVGYGGYPNLGLIQHTQIEQGFYERARRVLRRLWDADGSGPIPPDTTTYQYPSVDQWFPAGSIRLERVTHPRVDEVLPAGHGTIRREFMSLVDLASFTPYDKRQEAERRMRRGLLKSETGLNTSQGVIQTQTTRWQVTPVGSWLGEWTWYYYPGIPQQAFWVCHDTVSTTVDGVQRWTSYAYNAHGLVSRETVGHLKQGAAGLLPQSVRVTETRYHGDEMTAAAPLPVSWETPSPNADNMGTFSYNPLAASYNYVEATCSPNVGIDSQVQVTYTTQTWATTSPAYRIQGVVGVDNPQGTDLYSSAEVNVVWSNGSTQSLIFSTQTAPPGGPALSPSRARYNSVVLVPGGVTWGRVSIVLRSEVNKPSQSVYRTIWTFADSLMIQGITTGEDQTDALLVEARILDRPHVVSVKDAAGTLMRSTTTRYGSFGGLLLPDTTYVWEDRNGDHLVGPTEQVVQQRTLSYDAVGNPVEAADAAGVVTTTRWGYRKMQPVATFANARASQVTAWVFDDYPTWASLQADGWSAYTGGTGTISPTVGALQVAGTNGYWYAAKLNVTPADTAGVLECGAMMDARGDDSILTVYAGANYLVIWGFAADGMFAMYNGTAWQSLGVPYQVNRWYHIRLEWNGRAGWFAQVDGVRYPASGTYACGPGAGTTIDHIELWNFATVGSLFIDNLRTYPVTAQPLSLTTYDPVTLHITGVTDANGVTMRYGRDGLGRVVQRRDGGLRVVGQHGAFFSRGEGVTDLTPYHPATPNRDESVFYADPDGYRDLGGDRLVSSGPWSEEGRTITTGPGYVIPGGATITFRARTRIALKPGFRATTGATFCAMIDPAAGGMSSTGAVTFNVLQGAEQAARLDAAATLSTGTVSGHTTARVDFYPDATTGGTPTVLALDDGVQWIAVKYVASTQNFQLERRQGGQTTTVPWSGSGFYPASPVSAWNTCELEFTPAGTCYIWVYPQSRPRWVGLSATVPGFPANWTPTVYAQGQTGSCYLANLYAGPAEVKTTYYNGLARELQTRVRTGTTDIVLQTAYNRVNQPDSVIGPVGVAERYPYFDNVTSGGTVTTHAYWDDPLVRRKQVMPPGYTASNAVRARYGYGGIDSVSIPFRWATTLDENGMVTTQSFDPLGHLTKMVVDSGGTSARNATTTFAYDVLDQLISSTAPQGGTSAYVYDTLGRLVRKSEPDADDSTRFKYDIRGNVRFSQDARQAATTPRPVTFYVYDAVNRVTREGEAPLTAPAPQTFAALDPNTTYAFETDATSWRTKRSYDVDYLGSGVNYARGRLTKLEESTNGGNAAEVTVLFAYDREGRVRAKQVSLAGLSNPQLVQYQYDLTGRVSRMLYPDGSEVRYRYDSAGRLSRVTDATGAPYAAYTYAPDGNLATHVVGNTVVTGTYAYTLRDWVQKVDYSDVFLDTLRYDWVGNVTRQVYRQGTGTIQTATYGYDSLYRLTSYSLSPANQTQSFAYDLNGNLTSRTTNGSTLMYNYLDTASPNRLTSTTGTGGMNYAYNANGWMLNRGSDLLSYDYRGLVTRYKSTGSTTYLHDSEGSRVKKMDGTVPICYIRGADGAVLAEYDGSGSLTTKYVFAGPKRLAKVDGSGPQYYLTDHLGSTRALLKPDGTISATYDYWPYGEVWQQGGGGSDGTRYKFTGHERDGESNLDYMLARQIGPSW